MCAAGVIVAATVLAIVIPLCCWGLKTNSLPRLSRLVAASCLFVRVTCLFECILSLVEQQHGQQGKGPLPIALRLFQRIGVPFAVFPPCSVCLTWPTGPRRPQPEPVHSFMRMRMPAWDSFHYCWDWRPFARVWTCNKNASPSNVCFACGPEPCINKNALPSFVSALASGGTLNLDKFRSAICHLKLLSIHLKVLPEFVKERKKVLEGGGDLLFRIVGWF